jgi:hypothetical protein
MSWGGSACICTRRVGLDPSSRRSVPPGRDCYSLHDDCLITLTEAGHRYKGHEMSASGHNHRRAKKTLAGLALVPNEPLLRPSLDDGLRRKLKYVCMTPSRALTVLFLSSLFLLYYTTIQLYSSNCTLLSLSQQLPSTALTHDKVAC